MKEFSGEKNGFWTDLDDAFAFSKQGVFENMDRCIWQCRTRRIKKFRFFFWITILATRNRYWINLKHVHKTPQSVAVLSGDYSSP
jgi:hypothetical protein